MFLASSIAAFLRETRRVQLIEDGEIVAITPEGATFVGADDGAGARGVEVDWDDEAAEKGGYETFMLKEIYEQPDAVARDDRRAHPTRRRARARRPRPDRRRDCGTCAGSSSSPAAPRYHAGVVGRYVIEEWARIPVEPDIASEWRYRNPVIAPDTLVDRHLAVGRDARHGRTR